MNKFDYGYEEYLGMDVHPTGLTNFSREDFPTYRETIRVYEITTGILDKFYIVYEPMSGDYTPIPTDYSLHVRSRGDCSDFWNVFEKVCEYMPTKTRRAFNPEKYNKTLKQNTTTVKEVTNQLIHTLLVELKDVDNEKYYGILNYKEKGFITRRRYDDDKYIILSVDFLTNGNGWDYYTNDSISKVIGDFIWDGRGKVYEFDTSKELFQWLAE